MFRAFFSLETDCYSLRKELTGFDAAALNDW